MTAILLFILLVIIAVVAVVIINQSRAELGSKVEDILLEQARVAELKAELERAEVEEREELAALRLEMQILEKENAKNVLTLEKELIASGLKGKDAEDALRKELEETRLAEQVKVMAIQLQLDKVKTQEQNKVKTIQFELDKSQARIGLMEANVEKLKNKPIAEIADLKKKLSEAVISTRDAQEKVNAQASLIKSQKSEASKELKAIQAELNTLKQAEADKRKTLNTKLGDSADTIEDLEEEIAYLKSRAASVNKSPDIEKKKISIQSDEDRADAMDSQDIVEKKKSGNTPQSSSGRVITKGPKSLEMSPAMREKLQAARYKAENNEKNEALVDPASGRGAAPVPSINLEKLGPPSNIMRPAVCRDIPGSPVDSCGRPSKGGWVISAPTDGYVDNGLGFCKSGQIFASPGWALLNPSEPRKMASSFNDPLYREYAKRGQAKCDADPNCKFVTVWRDAGYRMYNSGAGNCSSKNDPSGANKSWKKPPMPKLPPFFKPVPPPNFGNPFKPPPPTFGTRLDLHFRLKRPSPPPPPPPPAKKNCAYSSVNLRGPGGWFGWSSEKDGLGREMKGIVVSKHKVNESAVGGGKKCCEALGCPSNCKDPGVGKHVYKKRETIGRIGYYASYWPSYKGKFTLERTSGQKACDNNSYV